MDVPDNTVNMDISQPPGEGFVASRESDIALAGKKAPSIATPHNEQDTDICSQGTSHDRNTGQWHNGRNTLSQRTDREHDDKLAQRPGVCRKAAGQNLVLQMYSHMKTQRRLEQEKNSKMARAERRRQKLRKDSPNRTFSDTSSLNRFGGYWTHCRVLRANKMAAVESREEHDSPVEELGDQQTVEAHTKSGVVRVPSSHSELDGRSGEPPGGVEFFGESDDLEGQTASPQGSPQTSPRQRYIRVSVSKTPSSEDNSRRRDAVDVSKTPDNNDSSSNNNANQSLNGTNYSNKAPHLLRGPGRIQIHFSQTPPLSRMRTCPGRKQSYQWGNMAAGTMTSAHQPALITLDGSML